MWGGWEGTRIGKYTSLIDSPTREFVGIYSTPILTNLFINIARFSTGPAGGGYRAYRRGGLRAARAKEPSDGRVGVR